MTGDKVSGRVGAPFAVAVAAILVGVGALLFVPSSAGASGTHRVRVAGTADDPSQTAYWDTRGYGICARVDAPSTPYTLPTAGPAGYQWTMLVLKGGPAGDGQYAQYPDPLPGTYYHPGGYTIDLVIRCKSNTGSPSTTTSTTTTTAADPCGPYTPRNLVADKSRVNPGELLTISGLGHGGDTLAITLTSVKITPRSLGTRILPPSGSFSIGVIMPDDVPVGATYTITLTSQVCARSGSVSVYVDPEIRSGCASTVPRVLIRGQAVSWKMVSGSPTGFDRSKTLKLTLSQRAVSGYTSTLWTGMWGANGTANFTTPLAAPMDRYYVIQSGIDKSNGLPKSESCQVRVADDYTTFVVSSHRNGFSDRWRQPVQIGVASLISLTALVRLRARHRVGLRRRNA